MNIKLSKAEQATIHAALSYWQAMEMDNQRRLDSSERFKTPGRKVKGKALERLTNRFAQAKSS